MRTFELVKITLINEFDLLRNPDIKSFVSKNNEAAFAIVWFAFGIRLTSQLGDGNQNLSVSFAATR
jgi:hypothetical protein